MPGGEGKSARTSPASPEGRAGGGGSSRPRRVPWRAAAGAGGHPSPEGAAAWGEALLGQGSSLRREDLARTDRSPPSPAPLLPERGQVKESGMKDRR